MRTSYLAAGEDLKDGVVNFGGDLQALDAPFGQLGVAHQDGENLVGAADFLADDADLLLDAELAVVDGALQAEGGVGDDAERILDLVGDFGGEAPGGAKTFLADGKFGGFGLGALLFFKEDLDAVAAGGPNDQDDHARDGVFGAHLGIGVADQQLLMQELPQQRHHLVVGCINQTLIQDSARHVAESDHQIEQDLRQGQRNGQGVVEDQDGKDPIQRAVEAVHDESQADHQQHVQQADGDIDPLGGFQAHLADPDENGARRDVGREIEPK